MPTAEGAKALPGSGQRVYVEDWNGDGVKDLVIGASVATVNGGEFSDELSWEWEDVNEVASAGKDPGLYPPRERPTEASMDRDGVRKLFGEEEFLELVKFNQDVWDDTIGRLYEEGKAYWLTMRHQGRIYVMLGERRETDTAAAEARHPASAARAASSITPRAGQSPVAVEMAVPEEVRAGEPADVVIRFSMRPPWYIYAPTERNALEGMIPARVDFEFPDGVAAAGSPILPLQHMNGPYDIYKGADQAWAQPVQASASGRYEVLADVTYQTCKDDLCLPPRTETLSAMLTVVDARD